MKTVTATVITPRDLFQDAQKLLVEHAESMDKPELVKSWGPDEDGDEGGSRYKGHKRVGQWKLTAYENTDNMTVGADVTDVYLHHYPSGYAFHRPPTNNWLVRDPKTGAWDPAAIVE